jgi:3-isopropylmalate/(R)-2-methylmalate dehydratase large subunit
VADWKTLKTDDGAHFDKLLELDVTDLAPYVTWGTNPEMGVPVDKPFPEVKDINDERAYRYMDMHPGQRASDIPLEMVFIGSCTNGRLSDVTEAAKIVEGKKVHPNITAIIVPGSRPVKKAAEKLGLDKVFIDAGFEWREPGCSMCLAMNPDKVPPKVHAASTTNRNFEGRQGKDSRTHLCSPVTAAAAAIAGKFVDVREIMRDSE